MLAESESVLPAARLLVAVPDDKVAVVLDRLRVASVDTAAAIFCIDPAGRLLGGAALERVLGAPPETRVADLLDSAWPRARELDPLEQVASRAIAAGVTVVPLVDAQGMLVGAVTPRSLLETLRREHVEDLHRLAGIQRENQQTREAIEEPPARRARHRLPWLLVGLAGSLVAAVVASRFERLLAERVAVAFFVPAIVYLADAIGTQTEAIVVRGLSLSHRPLRVLLGAELRTGLLMGVVLGVAALGGVTLLFGDPALGAAVGLAVLAAGAAATSIGLLLPWALQRMGSDPALGSGPLATVVQDIFSLVIYLTAASLIVGR